MSEETEKKQDPFETAEFYAVSGDKLPQNTEQDVVLQWEKKNADPNNSEATKRTLHVVAYKLVKVGERTYTDEDVKKICGSQPKAEPEPFFSNVTSLIAFDTETTGIDEENDIIISASLIRVEKTGVRETQDFLINPGLKEIPAEATAVHGISTEKARAEGVDVREALTKIRDTLEAGWKSGAVVVAMNASFDFTIFLNELKRYGLPTLEIGPIIDPIVLDRHYDKYRKGKRTLASLAEHYGVSLENAHSSNGDAMATARIAYVLIRKHKRAFDAMGKHGLHKLQQNAQEAWAANYQYYLRTMKNEPTAVIDGSWPVRKAKEKT